MAKRSAGGGKEDLRQKRSKRHLSEALLDLMKEKPYREISVVNICQRAMVHRTTFYAHFEDKNALLQYVLSELRGRFAQIHEQVAKSHGIRAALLEELRLCLDYMKENKAIYFSGLNGENVSTRIVEDVMAEVLSLRSREEGLWAEDPLGPEMAGRFYAGALISTFRWWLENDMPVTEETLLRQMEELMPAAVLEKDE